MFSVALVAALAGLSGDLPEKLYLTCEVSEGPQVAAADLYTVPPSDKSTIIKDLMRGGAVHLVAPPPNTWTIDRELHVIEAGPGGWRLTFGHIEISPNEISGFMTTDGGQFKTLIINRISGNLELTTEMPEAERKAWRTEHGKPFPSLVTWKQRCQASSEHAF